MATKNEANKSLKLSSLAPNWVKDGFKELTRKGKSAEQAISTLKRSPFFNEEWVA